MEPEFTSEDEEAEDGERPSRLAEDDVDDEGFSRLDRIKICISFGGIAVLLHSFTTVAISASQDILAGTYIPTTTILSSHVATMVVVTACLPWFMQKIPYFWRTLIVIFAMVGGTLVLITVNNVYVKILGVSLNALAHGLGEISFLALCSFYGKISVTSFAAGSGAGILLGPIYFTAMTSWVCISPQITLAIISPAPLLVLLFYYILDKDRLKPYALLHYKKLKSSDDSQVSEEQSTNPFLLSWREKLSAAWQILPQILTLCSAYVAQYVTVHAVFTTIAFGNAPFAPRDHYVYYVLLNSAGECLLRSYLSIVAWIKPQLISRLVIKRTWIFSLVSLGVMIFSICASYYRLFNSVWWVLFLCFFIGSMTGLVFANIVCAVPLIVDPNYREFCMGLVTFGESAGILIASFGGIAIEPALRTHCSVISKDSSLCFTRHKNYGWNSVVCSAKG